MAYFDDTEVAFASQSDQALKKSYLLFKLIGSPLLTKIGSFLLRLSLRWHLPVERLVKQTVFQHFVAGESLEEAQAVIDKLLHYNISSIMDYAVEGKAVEAEFERSFQAILAGIDFASTQRGIPFVVFKPSGFGRPALYQKVSEGQPLSPAEQAEWKRVVARYDSVCQKAEEHELTVMVDAEESWTQQAVDGLVFDMMRRYNRRRCTVCNTLQMYCKDRLAYLKRCFEAAEQEDFLIGYKVVRGAYMEKEAARAKALGYENPIHPNKQAADRDYDAAVDFIVDHLDRVSLFAGTHNEASCHRLKQRIQEKGIANDCHKVWFGQLYGMSDHISFDLARQGYNVAKYLPYGPLRDVIPYLIRRARENSSIKGQSSRELRLIQAELKRRASIKNNTYVSGYHC